MVRKTKNNLKCPKCGANMYICKACEVTEHYYITKQKKIYKKPHITDFGNEQLGEYIICEQCDYKEELETKEVEE